jgi:ornithine cyclodeaminase/alanine dehydrogenase-like protein (mu-crystallin family)
MAILYLTEADVRQVLTMDLALPAVEAAFRKISLDEAVNIPRQRCQTDRVMLHVLPAAAKTLGALGFKAYTTCKNGAKFLVSLFDPLNGGLTAMIEADYLGQVRTGAASGVVTKKLARPDATTLGLFGSGRQARTQLEAIANVRRLSHVLVFSRAPQKRVAFAAEMSAKLGIPVHAAESAEQAARNRDIIATATNSREPFLMGEWIAEGCHINLIGSNFLAKTEAAAGVFRKTTLVTVDSKDQAKAEAGDFVSAMKDGILTWAEIYEFSHILTGRYPGRQSPQDMTLFKSLGLGIQDIAVGVKVVEAARAAGLGREIDIGQ